MSEPQSPACQPVGSFAGRVPVTISVLGPGLCYVSDDDGCCWMLDRMQSASGMPDRDRAIALALLDLARDHLTTDIRIDRGST